MAKARGLEEARCLPWQRHSRCCGIWAPRRACVCSERIGPDRNRRFLQLHRAELTTCRSVQHCAPGTPHIACPGRIYRERRRGIMHVAEIFTPRAQLHELGLLLVSFGFGALTAIAIVMLSREGHSATARARQRILAAMSLFLLATSFLHFGGTHAHAWSEEIALHHAGIPIALMCCFRTTAFCCSTRSCAFWQTPSLRSR